VLKSEIVRWHGQAVKVCHRLSIGGLVRLSLSSEGDALDVYGWTGLPFFQKPDQFQKAVLPLTPYDVIYFRKVI
jgi:hypothetical protein